MFKPSRDIPLLLSALKRTQTWSNVLGSGNVEIIKHVYYKNRYALAPRCFPILHLTTKLASNQAKKPRLEESADPRPREEEDSEDDKVDEEREARRKIPSAMPPDPFTFPDAFSQEPATHQCYA